MTIFMCKACGFEIDYDESSYKCIECEECGGLMTGIEDADL